MTETPWSITFTRRADKDMKRLDHVVRQRVAGALERLADDAHSGKLRKLTGRPESRLRVGDWRVLVEIDEKGRTVEVQRVLPRGHAYKR